jgi:hypothetical protein
LKLIFLKRKQKRPAVEFNHPNQGLQFSDFIKEPKTTCKTGKKQQREIHSPSSKNKVEVLTHYFSKDLTNPDSENFFGNGILLHKLRTSTHARYFNALSLLKILTFEPLLVSLQMLPGMQISLLLLIQASYVGWLAFCGFKEKIFVSKAVFLATLICDTSILFFLLLGLVFHLSGGVKSWPTSTSTPLQFTGVALLLFSCLFGMVDLVVSAC